MLICDFCHMHSALGSSKCGRALVTANCRLLIAACRAIALPPVRSQTRRGELGPNWNLGFDEFRQKK